MRPVVRRFLLTAATILVAAGSFDLYARWPSSVAADPVAVPAGTEELILLFHGSGGRDEPTLKALEQRFRELAADRPGVAVVRYVWSPASDNRYRSHVAGQQVGMALGAELGNVPELRVLRLVGHSAGGYVMEYLCESYRETLTARSPSGRSNVAIGMTFLDPIGFEGALDTGWGVRHLGECADFAEAILNLDDPTPATNAPLRNAWNLDVTGLGHTAGFAGGGHRWPVQYYREQLGPADLEVPANGHRDRPRGAVVTASSIPPPAG